MTSVAKWFSSYYPEDGRARSTTRAVKYLRGMQLEAKTIEDLRNIDQGYMAFLEKVTSPSRFRHHYEQRVNIRKRKVGVYSPSGLGYCKYRQLLRRQGIRGDYNLKPKTQGIFDFGHALHAYWQSLDEEIHGSDKYTAEVPVEIPELHLFGTCDAEIVYPWVAYINEYKTINGDSFKNLIQPLPSHLKQITTYMKARNRPFGWIRYICKATAMTKDFFVPFVESIWEQVEGLLTELEEAYQTGSEVEKTVGYQCGECQYILECNPYGS